MHARSTGGRRDGRRSVGLRRLCRPGGAVSAGRAAVSDSSLDNVWRVGRLGRPDLGAGCPSREHSRQLRCAGTDQRRVADNRARGYGGSNGHRVDTVRCRRSSTSGRSAAGYDEGRGKRLRGQAESPSAFEAEAAGAHGASDPGAGPVGVAEPSGAAASRAGAEPETEGPGFTEQGRGRGAAEPRPLLVPRESLQRLVAAGSPALARLCPGSAPPDARDRRSFASSASAEQGAVRPSTRRERPRRNPIPRVTTAATRPVVPGSRRACRS